MLTEAFAAAVLASSSPDPASAVASPPGEVRGPAKWYRVHPVDARRFSVAGHFVTQVIGLGFGARVEAMYRPFRHDRGANILVSLGAQGGPEVATMPLDIGWRQHFVPHPILTLELGAGYEQQTFFVRDIAPISRPAFYLEGGFAFRVVEGGWLGAHLAPSYAPFQRPGPGLAVRLGFRWTLGRRDEE